MTTSRKKNPNRVAAGKLNRLKAGPIGSKGLINLRHSALTNRPWERSTGPKSDRGKRIAAANGAIRQKGPWSARQVRRELKHLNQLVDQLAIAIEQGVDCLSPGWDHD